MTADEATTALPERVRETKKEKKPKKQQQQQQQQKKQVVQGTALEGITVMKEEDLGVWYQQVLTKGKMMAYYDVSGCYIILPPAYSIWERIKRWFDDRIADLGVENCYFPLFISGDNLQREKDHVEGFAAEVAWVTQGGKSKLEKPVAVRPTSETAMYGYFADVIRSHRDLPLKLNQWNNVVRWEFKHPQPFIRTREFLWQEGHTAHMTFEEAAKEVRQILDFYTGVYQDLLAIPVVQGTKTENEKFPGAEYTTTIEGFIPSTGRGVQAATSHCLGQHFAKMFDIKVQDPNAKEDEAGKHVHVWQNSWGLTTRSIGVMVLIHSDNKGLVVPPRVANKQVVIIPVGITAKTTEEGKQKHYAEIESIAQTLRGVGVRVETDFREGYNAGYKFNDWELKGVPLRLEVGPKDLANKVVTFSRRELDGKGTIPIADIEKEIPQLLETIQKDMFQRADDAYRAHRKLIANWDDFVPALNEKNVCIIPHCLGGDCEDKIKELSARKEEGDNSAEDARAPAMGAKSLCIPFEQPKDIPEGTKCTNPECSAMAQKWVMFGRSY